MLAVADRTIAPSPEWWEVWAGRRAVWWQARPTLARRWARVRALGLWVATAWVIALLVLWPDVALGIRAYLGAFWVVVAWFFLARTKSLTWSGYLTFFSACVIWSVLIGVISTILSVAVVGRDVGFAGPVVMIASITEETLKLLPIALVAAMAPRRAARFAAVDWALLGLASGSAFLAVEESARRVFIMGVDTVGTLLVRLGTADGQVPEGLTRFGAWPVPTEASGTGPAGFGGHGVVTAIITGLVGLGIAGWQITRHSPAHVRVPVRSIATVLPLLALVSAIADHAGLNVQSRGAHNTAADGTPLWLDPKATLVPWWIRTTWSWLGHGHGRAWVFVAVVVVCLVVDAGRLSSHRESNLLGLPRPRWVEGAAMRIGTRAAGPSAVAPTVVVPAVRAVAALAWLTVRDLHEQVTSRATTRGESRLAAARSGALVAAAQRAVREVTYEHLAAPISVRRRRIVATCALAALLLAGLLLAPRYAAEMAMLPYQRYSEGWLAGVLDGLGGWWHDLHPAQQIAVGIGIAALVALSGGSLAMAFGIAGVATWGLDKAHGLATFTRDPRRATIDYIQTATPGQLVADTVGVALTFAPGNFTGAAVGQGMRTIAGRYAADPATFVRTRRAAIQGDAGIVDPQAFARGKPIELADGSYLAALSPVDEAEAARRYASHAPTHVKGAPGPAREGQIRVYGHDERVIPTPAGNVHPDGLTAQYGALGDYKHVISEKTWHDPRTLNHPELEDLATRRIDATLGRLQLAAEEIMGQGRGHVEITTNSAGAAQFIEIRMRALGIRGFVRLVTEGTSLG